MNEILLQNVGASNERKGRPRMFDIDRATVLSINRKLACRRCCRHRELSWPPINNNNKYKANDRIKFSEQLYKKRDIKDLCRKYDELVQNEYSHRNTKRSFYDSSIVKNNKANANTLPIVSISDIDSHDEYTNPAASNNIHNNDPIESINKNPTNNSYNRHTSDYKLHGSYIDSSETIKPFSDRKITAVNSYNNNNSGADKDQTKVPLKRSKSYNDDSTTSNIIVDEINNRKNTNLHFIGYSERLRCSSRYNELTSLKWKNNINYIYPSKEEYPEENLSENEKTIKMQVYQPDGCYCDDNISGNKYRNVEIKLNSSDSFNINRPVRLDAYIHHQCYNCGSWCGGRNIFKYSDTDRNRFFDENSRIDIEKNDFICCCNSSNHMCNSVESNKWMGCIGCGNESENNWFVFRFF